MQISHPGAVVVLLGFLLGADAFLLGADAFKLYGRLLQRTRNTHGVR